MTMRFDIQNPLAAKAALTEAVRLSTRACDYNLVQGITAETRAALRALISRSFADALPPRKTAPIIKTMIGLTDRQARAVMNVWKAWEAAGVTGEKLEKRVARYADKLLRQRAMTIARTESINAANAGQLAAWQQAADSGLIQRERTRLHSTRSSGARRSTTTKSTSRPSVSRK